MNIPEVQKDILDNYFNQLKSFGYLSQFKVDQVVFAVLLLDAVGMFEEYLTGDFRKNVDIIMRRLDCCSCSISWAKANLSSPFYVMGQWHTGVVSHTHIISEIIGLESRLNELKEQIRRTDAKANAGL